MADQSRGKDAEIGSDEFDFAGWHFGVDGGGVAGDELAFDCDDEFGAAGEGDIEEGGVDALVEGALEDAGAVAHEEEEDAAFIADAVYPAVDGNGAACVGGTEAAAHVGAFHAGDIGIHGVSVLLC